MIDALLSGPRAPPTVLQPMAGTEPDLDLIKQVETGDKVGFGRTAPRFAGVPSVGITGAVEVLVFLISQLLHWLLFGCKNSQERPRPVCEGASPAMLPAPRGGFTNRATCGCRAVALPNSVRLIHNRGNLACCRDFKVSHYSGNESPPGEEAIWRIRFGWG